MSFEIPSIKVVMLGESGVGKTSIISRYITNTYNKIEKSTLGASFLSKIMKFEQYDGKALRYEIWDTAGQERFRSITRIFYKDATAAILVYDITRKTSFIELQNYWYQQIKESASNKISN